MIRILSILFCVVGFACHADPRPLPSAHAHNDYLHPRPLLDALSHGFCGIEADVWLMDGQLLVAHDKEKVVPGRTLQSLYLDPLRQRVAANNGKVYPGGPPIMLLVDIKSDGPTTYTRLEEVLSPYQEILTSVDSGKVTPRGVTVIVSGNRPRALMESRDKRLTFYDGRLEDLAAAPASPSFMPLISADWRRVFQWRGDGAMPEPERAKLRELVATTKARGHKLRFWGTPDKESVWNELLAAQVDWINADDLAGLRRFLQNQK